MENALKIKTPEGITFSFQLAGPILRCLAWSIDLMCIAALQTLLRQLVGIVSLVNADIATGATVIAYFAISIGYGIACEWLWQGRTVGKRLLGLRVIDLHGLRLHFSQIAIRNLLRFADMLPGPYLVGGIAMLCNSRAQRLGDLAGNTVVIRHIRPREPDLEKLRGGKFNSLRSVPHLAARLRQRTSPAEAQLVLQALLRRDEFEPAARVDLFAELAAHFRGIVEFPPEILESLADEQYIRNVAEILFANAAETTRSAPAKSAEKIGPAGFEPATS